MEVALYAEIYLFCILLVNLVLFWSTHSNANSASERWFNLVLFFFSCSFIANYLFTVINGWTMSASPDLRIPWILKSLYYLLLTTGVYFWCVYTEVELGYEAFRPLHKLPLQLIPLAVPVAIVLSNFRTHQLFYITENHTYVRGPFVHLLVLFLLISTILADVRILHASRDETDPVVLHQRKQLTTFPICILTGWVLSLINGKLPVMCICITTELLCLYVGSSTRQIMIDRLTQVNNRQNLSRFLSNKLRSHTDELFLLMIDVDYFKSINDNYGHLEGDEALIRVANALKQGCTTCRKHPYIARYGGDEFIIVAELSEDEIQELCTSIRDKLKELNDKAGARYSLNLSIGYAEWQEGMTSSELINIADYNLYKEKASRDRKTGKSGKGRRTRKIKKAEKAKNNTAAGNNGSLANNSNSGSVANNSNNGSIANGNSTDSAGKAG